MHDTFLFKKIADTISDICLKNQIGKITYLEVDVHYDSHVNNDSLFQHLNEECPTIIDTNTIIQVNNGDTEALTAVIKTVEGIHNETLPH